VLGVEGLVQRDAEAAQHRPRPKRPGEQLLAPGPGRRPAIEQAERWLQRGQGRQRQRPSLKDIVEVDPTAAPRRSPPAHSLQAQLRTRRALSAVGAGVAGRA
jgi:hypothetical protein